MKIHIMGIGGSVMSNFAVLLKNLGHEVTGSDLSIYDPALSLLQKNKISVKEGYKKENLDHNPDYVVVGNVISEHFEEVQQMKEKKLLFLSFPEALRKWVIEDRRSLMVSGTHGKTTTTSLLAWTAEVCGLDPGFLVGGIPLNQDQPFKIPKEKTFIIEGDEYDTAFFDKRPKFVHYQPGSVILTGIEFDHGDIYKDIQDVKKAFELLLKNITVGGYLFYFEEDRNIKDILSLGLGDHLKCFSYGKRGAHYTLENRKIEKQKQSFTACFSGEILKEDITLNLMGEHNALNALAVFALSHQLSWDLDKAKESFASFLGVKRRGEILGQNEKLTLVEDFAHHPTALKAMIKTIKEHFPSHKLISIFEPRSNTSQRAFFQKDYVEAFENSDYVLVPRHLTKEDKIKDEILSIEELLKDLKKQSVECNSFHEASQALDFIKEYMKDSSSSFVVLAMSNGNFGGLFPLLQKELFSS